VSATVVVTEDVTVVVNPMRPQIDVYDSATVTEDVATRLSLGSIDVYDSATVTESVTPNLVCLIKPVTITDIQLWSKLNSAADVTFPTTGTGGAEVGSPTYVAAKFGNGIFSDVDSEGCTFPTAANSINLDKGTIEFWTKMNFDETDVDTHYFIDFYETGSGGIRLFFHRDADDFYVLVWSEGNLKVNMVTTGMTWSSGDLLHFGLTWDREGNDIGSSKTIALYIDNVEKVSSTTTWNTDAVNANLYVGIEKGGILHSDAVIDNLKTYDVCKTDFSHKEIEGVSFGPVERVTASESIAMTGASYVSVSDNVIVTDVDCVKLLTLFNLAVDDSITVTEDIARRLTSNISVYDSVLLTELVSTIASLGDIEVSDNVTVTENVVTCLVNLISTNDSVTITDTVSAIASLAGISVYDTVTIIEKLYFEWWIGVDEPTPDWTDLEPEADDPTDPDWTDIEPEETGWTDV